MPDKNGKSENVTEKVRETNRPSHRVSTNYIKLIYFGEFIQIVLFLTILINYILYENQHNTPRWTEWSSEVRVCVSIWIREQ